MITLKVDYQNKNAPSDIYDFTSLSNFFMFKFKSDKLVFSKEFLDKTSDLKALS